MITTWHQIIIIAAGMVLAFSVLFAPNVVAWWRRRRIRRQERRLMNRLQIVFKRKK